MEVWNSMKTQTTTDRTARHHHSHFLSRRVFTNKRTREPRVVGWVSAEGIVLLSIKVLGSQRIPYYAKKTKLFCLFALGFASKGDEILIGNHLGADEAALDVTVDFSRSFPSVGSLRDRPCADFVFARGQKTDQIQKGVGRMDKPVSRRLFDADFFQERLAVALFELCDFHFHLA